MSNWKDSFIIEEAYFNNQSLLTALNDNSKSMPVNIIRYYYTGNIISRLSEKNMRMSAIIKKMEECYWPVHSYKLSSKCNALLLANELTFTEALKELLQKKEYFHVLSASRVILQNGRPVFFSERKIVDLKSPNCPTIENLKFLARLK